MTFIKTTENNRDGEKGNVLFLILIAVALFAALSYAVTSSSRSGGNDASSETNLVNSAQVSQYPSAVRTSLIRMIVSSGITADLMQFDSPSDFGSVTQSYSVFHPAGGGATYMQAPAEVMLDGAQGTWIFTSAYQIDQIGTTPGDNTGSDIIAFLPGIKETICEKINSELGIGTTDDDNSNGVPDAGIAIANAPTVADNQDSGNTGIETYDANNIIDGPDLVGQPYGCADFDDADGDGTNTDDFVYFHVLIER